MSIESTFRQKASGALIDVCFYSSHETKIQLFLNKLNYNGRSYNSWTWQGK